MIGNSKSIIYESQKYLHNLIYTENKELFLHTSYSSAACIIDILFNVGNYTIEKAELLQKYTRLLICNKDGGLYGLSQRALEYRRTKYKKPCVKDEWITGYKGLFKSDLEVKGGKILYNITFPCDFAIGFCNYDLGSAHLWELHIFQKNIELMENNYLEQFMLKLQGLRELDKIKM